MTPSNDNSKGWASWVKWLVGTIIALLAAGSGIVALLNYIGNNRLEAQQRYQTELTEWLNFSPSSLGGEQNMVLRGVDRIDLESGRISSNPPPDRKWDLLFGCGPEQMESLRAIGDAQWYEKGVADFHRIQYREIRDANYHANTHPITGYNDFYYSHISNVPGNGHLFFIKTNEGNVAKLQIMGYELFDNNPYVCRNMKIRYEVFPVEIDPPKPIPPD